ncbi:MAG: hypothetical protein AAF631_02045 [Pseudomonadota bacterium]
MGRILTAAAVLALSAAFHPGAAQAGDAAMSRSDGSKLTIKCRGSGCTVKYQKAGSRKWSTVERGPGGSKNFKKVKAKYEDMGFK